MPSVSRAAAEVLAPSGVAGAFEFPQERERLVAAASVPLQ